MRLSAGSVIVDASIEVDDPATFAAAEQALGQDTASLSAALGVVVLEKPTVAAVRKPPAKAAERPAEPHKERAPPVEAIAEVAAEKARPMEAQAREWVEAMVGERLGEGTLQEELKSGVGQLAQTRTHPATATCNLAAFLPRAARSPC